MCPQRWNLKKSHNSSAAEHLQTSLCRAWAAWLNLCVSFKEASHQMSYFGQRLKIYFRCKQEQLSNRLIMILESQAPPAPRGRTPELWVLLGDS